MSLEELNYLLSFILILLMVINSFLKTNERFFIILFNLMNSIGAIFYVFGGNLYKKPSAEVLYYLLLILIIINVFYLLYYIIFYYKKNKYMYLKQILYNKFLKKLKWDKILMLISFFFLPFFYFLIFYNKFPIYYMILGEAIGESARPDVSGSLPHFYTFSVFLGSFTFPFLIYLYFKVKKIFKILILLIMIFFAFLIGDKSTLMVLIFYIYLYKGKKVSFTKVLIFSIFFIGFYVLMKYLYYESLRYEDISALFESIFRRVCVIQPSAFGVYLDYFTIHHGVIPSEFRHIKQFLFYLIYGYMEGGLSVIFPASFLDYIGIGFFQIIFVGEVFFVILIIRKIIFDLKYKVFKEIIDYLHFYGAILLAQGFISDLIIRWFFPVIFFILLDLVMYKVFYIRKVKYA